MKKLLVTFSLMFAITCAYSQKVADPPASGITTIKGQDLKQIPSGSVTEILRSLQPMVSVGPSWATGKDSGTDWEYSYKPRIEIIFGAYRDFILNENFNSKFRTRAGLRLRIGGTIEKWDFFEVAGEYKVSWSYLEAPAEIAYKFEAFGKPAYAGLGLVPAIKLSANVKDDDGEKYKLEDIKGFNIFISPLIGFQLTDHGELDLNYDYGMISWGGSGDHKAHRINSVNVRYVHMFY